MPVWAASTNGAGVKASFSLSNLGKSDPQSLADTRVALHWAAQVLSAAADAHLEKQSDDSQSNVSWDAERGALVGRSLPAGNRVELIFSSGTIAVVGPRQSAQIGIAGHALDALLSKTAAALAEAGESEKPLAARDYDMPESTIAEGSPFPTINETAAAELAGWLSGAQTAIDRLVTEVDREVANSIAVWPHHFDLGGIFFLDKESDPHSAPQIGFGFSPGDASYAEPYFYVMPWPIDADDLPELPGGAHWHTDGFTGAILTAGTILQQPDADDAASRYLASAVAHGRRLIQRKSES